jgi:CDP-glucose 4,6-dehydratase
MWKQPEVFAGAWNFGPRLDNTATVSDIVNLVIKEWGCGEWEKASVGPEALYEARGLQLDSTKATMQLGWRPIFSLNETVQRSIAWYQRYYSSSRFDGSALTLQEINTYTKRAYLANVPWAVSNL